MARVVALFAVIGAALGVLLVLRAKQRNLTVVDTVSETVAEVEKVTNQVLKRGIRNNNPGNIEYDGTRWQGIAEPPSDGRFVRFVKPEYGVRAIGRVLRTYKREYGINTIAGVISRWSPEFGKDGKKENDTPRLIENAARRTGLAPYQVIDLEAWLGAIAAAIMVQENSSFPYTQAEVEIWVRLP